MHRFTEKKDDVDIIFIGSSRSYHGIAPKVFDQTLLASGYEWRSFNMAMDGMTTAESFAMVRRLLALHPRKLKFIFFETQSVITAGTPTGDRKVTERDVYWRDWESLLSGFRMFDMGLALPSGVVAGTPYSFRRWNDFGTLLFANVHLWIRNVTNVGIAMEILRGAIDTLPPRPPPIPTRIQRSQFAVELGWLLCHVESNVGSYPNDLPQGFREHAGSTGSTSTQPNDAQRTGALRARNDCEKISKWFSWSLLLPKGVEDAGINVPSGSRLLSYDDFARYPQFYEEENRLDTEHLNARGAEIFTRVLAQEFAHSLDSAAR